MTHLLQLHSKLLRLHLEVEMTLLLFLSVVKLPTSQRGARIVK